MDDCAVCYENVSESTGHCTLSCKHSFHIACLTRWSAENPSCPMCRHPLGVTEAPAKQLMERHNMSGWRINIGRGGQGQGALVDLIREAMGPEPVQPPPPPRPPHVSRILNIGDGVQVSEEEVVLVMQHAGVARGEAVRALRRYEGDIVNSILMLTSPDEVTLRPPPPRDPMRMESDDQATAWFLQKMFDDDPPAIPAVFTSYRDLRVRMKNGVRAGYWQHYEFIVDPPNANVDGYESA